jgi:hypothetical protein
LDNGAKNNIIRKFADKNFRKFSFLKNSEPDKYLYACAMTNKKLATEEIESLYSQLNKQQKSFGIWCIGKLNNWELLKREITEYLRESKSTTMNFEYATSDEQ